MPPVRDLALLESPPPVAVGSHALLDVAYADTRADELSHALDLPAQPALRALEIEVGELRIGLRILGYSHQVVVAGRDGELLLTETVARLSGPARREATRVVPLPERHDERRETSRLGRLRYSMDTSVTPLSELVDIEALMVEIDGAERGVLGVFPGHPHAFTGLVAVGDEPAGAQWRSWHAYPTTNELVRTRSRLVRDPA